MSNSSPSSTLAERASIFDEEIDISGFSPRKSNESLNPDKAALRAVAEARGFASREPESVTPDPEPLLQRRYRTGRNRQLNLKVTDTALRRFYAIADEEGIVLGELFEYAVEALSQALKRGETFTRKKVR